MSLSYFVAIIQGALKKRIYLKYLPLVVFVGYIFLNLLITDVEIGRFKFLVLFFRALFGILVIESYLNLGYRLDSRFVISIGVIISTILLYNSSLNDFVFRTSILMNESTEKSQQIVGVIEDSRTLIFIITYFIFRFKTKLIYVIIFTLLLAGLMVTQTRQSILVLIILIIPFIFIRSYKDRNFKGIKMITILLIAIPFLLYFIFDVMLDYYSLFRIDSIERDLTTSEYGRFNLMKWAIDLFIEKPFFGWGFGYTDDTITYPHNIILEILAELGIIGFILFSWFLIVRFINVRNTQIRLLITIFFVLSLFSGNLAQNYLLFFALIIDSRIFESANERNDNLLYN